MTADDYETIIAKGAKPPPKPGPYLPNPREHFWLIVGCVGASGVAAGLALQSIVYQIAEAIGG